MRRAHEFALRVASVIRFGIILGLVVAAPQGGCDDPVYPSVDLRRSGDEGPAVDGDSSPDLLMPGEAPFGAPCGRNEDCKSLRCFAAGRCTRGCRDAKDCPPAPDWKCEVVKGAGDLCVCEPSGPELCDGRDNDCNGIIDDGARCQGNELCTESGKCGCPLLCGKSCVDPKRDVGNCGACGKRCVAGETCEDGQCRCPMMNLCAGVCADFSSDPMNCGGCAANGMARLTSCELASTMATIASTRLERTSNERVRW